IQAEIDGQPYETFHQLTWNTYASVFEESLLDRRADARLELYYGADDEEALRLVRRSAFDEEIQPTRRTWHLGERIEVTIEVAAEGEDTWQKVAEATFER
ncbi:MAG: hypothetical protein AAF657_24210, partial [Acidobacteriota bacterium]